MPRVLARGEISIFCMVFLESPKSSEAVLVPKSACTATHREDRKPQNPYFSFFCPSSIQWIFRSVNLPGQVLFTAEADMLNIKSG